MCGISGFFLKSGELPSREVLNAMTLALARRGPDSQGAWIDQNVALGHRRLKIVDLSESANQPMLNARRDLVLVFNGEIYNHLQLRKELEAIGSRFRTRSDTEVILEAFDRWGTDSFRRFNGIFAFGLLDLRAREKKLYLVRDRFGVKPLFYSLESGRLTFASELRPLMRCPWISSGLDRDAVAYFLKFSHVPHPYSLLTSVRQLNPGHWLEYTQKRHSQSVFWDPSELFSNSSPSDRRTEADYLAELEEVLDRSVLRQTMSDVPLGSFLSGGIDSSLITSSLVKASAVRAKTFSIGYSESKYDETPFALEVADALGTDHTQIIASPEDFSGLLTTLPSLLDQPLADPTLLPTLLLCKNARQSVTVALAGDGGDELFFGYLYQKLLYRLKSLENVPGKLRELVFQGMGRFFSSGSRSGKMLQILQFKTEDQLLAYFIGNAGPLRVDRIWSFLVDAPRSLPPFANGLSTQIMGDIPFHEKISRVFFETFLVDTVLAKGDRAGMAFGLELRVPFLDNELVDFSGRLPFDLKFRSGSSKYLLRKLMEKRIPGRLSRRPKQGFSFPMSEWLRGPFSHLIDEYLDLNRLKSEGVFATAPVEKLIREHRSGMSNHSHLLWSLLSFQMWKGANLP